MLEQSRPSDADVGAANDRTVDVTAEAPPATLKPNCRPSTSGAQVEPGRLQPANGQVLELVAGIEDPQQPAVELLAVVDRRERDLVGEPAGARLADPAAAEIVARRLGSRGGLERQRRSAR